MNKRDLYKSIVVENSTRPRNKRIPSGEFMKITAYGENCNDKFEVFLKTKNGIVHDACFDGDGCALSVASLNIFLTMISGKTFDEIKVVANNFFALLQSKPYNENELGDLIAFTNVVNLPSRIPCVVLGIKAIVGGVCG